MRTRVLVKVVLLSAMVGLVTSCPHFDKKVNLALVVHSAPPELQTIAERSQQILVAAVDSNWPQVQAYAKDINAAWQQYRGPAVTPLSYPRPPALLLRGPLEGAMFRLRYAVGKGETGETMKAANEIDAAAIQVFEYYAPTIPLDLRRLRMLEGRIMVQAVQNRTDLASDSLKEIRTVWKRLRPTVEAQSSPEAAAAFEDCLLAQQAALDRYDPDALVACARQAFDKTSEALRQSYEKGR